MERLPSPFWITQEMTEVFHQVRQAFIDKHGREPEPDELLFTDLPHLEHLEAMMVEDMKAAGLDPAFIHAFEKTGILVSEENQHLIPEKDLDEWRSAVEEYRRKHSRRQKPVKYPMGTMALRTRQQDHDQDRRVCVPAGRFLMRFSSDGLPPTSRPASKSSERSRTSSRSTESSRLK